MASRRPSNSMRSGKVVNGSGALQSILSLPPGTIVMFGDEEMIWRSAKLLVVSAAPVRLGGGLELTVTFRKTENDHQEITETLTLPAGHLPLVVDEDSLVDCEDVSLLSDIHEANILHCLHLRFSQGRYFTRVGNILISVRPPNSVVKTRALDKSSWKRGRLDVTMRNRAHVFDVSEACLDNAIRDSKPQSAVLIGESGSGKTTCGNHFLDYFIPSTTRDVGMLTPSSMAALRRVLASFGHATTHANDDSTRLGLSWQIRLESGGTCVGLRVSSLLLDVKRVTNHRVDERNFHVFYELCKSSPHLRKRLHLEGMKPRDFKFMRPSHDSTDTAPDPSAGRFLRGDGVNDGDMAVELANGLECLASSGNLLRHTAAILHLGEVEFENVEGAKVKPSSAKSLSIAAHLLGVEDRVLMEACTLKHMQGSSLRLTVSDACACRDALARGIYQSQVSDLTTCINDTYGLVECATTVSLFDLPAFDSATETNFDNLLINFGCEYLQRVFVHEVFEVEREHCEMEGVECAVVSDLSTDNSKRLVALAGSEHPCLLPSNNSPPADKISFGLFQVLKELGEKTDEYDVNLIKDRVGMPSLLYSNNSERLTIVHYFGGVSYDITSFPTRVANVPIHGELEKRGINNSLKALSQRSDLVLKEISTISEEIKKTSPFFIKCLRAVPPRPHNTPPNKGSASSTLFDRRHVCEQLRSSGLLDAASLLQRSRPIRWSHADFARKFTRLLENRARPQPSTEVMSAEVAASWQQKETTPLVSYMVTFHSSSMGFGLKFVRSGLPVVARRTPKAPACVLAGHVLRTVAGVDLFDVKKTTMAEAEADGKDGPKEFQRVVASLLRDSPRPLFVTFIAPATDADLVISHAVLQKFIAQLEPAQLPSLMQEQLLTALHENANQPASQAYGEKVLASVGVAVGKKSVMFNHECSLLLERCLEAHLDTAASKIQALFRTWSRHRKMWAVLYMQRVARGVADRKKANAIKETRAQFIASFVLLRALKKWRGYRVHRGATSVQALYRGARTRAHLNHLRNQAVRIQTMARSKLARKRSQQRAEDLREGQELRELVRKLRNTVDEINGPQGAKHKLRQARASWDEHRTELEGKVKQLQSQLSETTLQAKRTNATNMKLLGAKDAELLRLGKWKQTAEKKLADFEAMNLSAAQSKGSKLSEALSALSTMRVQYQEMSSKQEVANDTITSLELSLANVVDELAQEKSRTALLEEKLMSTLSIQETLENTEAELVSTQTQLAEVSNQLTQAHRATKELADEVLSSQHSTGTEEVSESFAYHFANETHEAGKENNDEGEDNIVSILEEKLRESEYLIHSLQAKLAESLENQHAPMSELAALADSDGDSGLSRSELEQMLEQSRQECKEARYRADGETTVLRQVTAQKHQLSVALKETTKSLRDVMNEQEIYRDKEVAAALAAKRLKQAVTEANDRSSQIRLMHEKAEEKRKLAEESLSKMTKDLEKANAKCSELETSLIALVDECSNAREQKFAASSSAQEKLQALSDLDANHKALSQAHSQAEAALLRHKQRTEELEAELKQQKALSYSAVNNLESRLNETLAQLSTREKSVAVLEGSVLKLADDLSQATSEKQKLASTIEQQSEELALMKEELAVAKQGHEEALSSLKVECNTRTDLEAELKQQKSLSYSAVNNLENRLNDATAQLETLNQERISLQTDLSVSKAKEVDSTKLHTEATQQLKEAESELQRVSDELEVCKMDNVDLEKRMEEEKRRHSLVSKQLARIQKELEEATLQSRQWESEEREARELADKLGTQLSKVEAICERQKGAVEAAASMEAELNKVKAFQASYSQHSARAQQLELLVTELTAKCEEQQKKLNGNPEVLKLRKELASSQKKEKAHASALDDALASIASMQERAAIAQRRVWQGKVTTLQEKLKAAETSLEASNKKTMELEEIIKRK